MRSSENQLKTYVGQEVHHGLNDFIETLADQYHGLEKVNSTVQIDDILESAFAGFSKKDKGKLSKVFMGRMIGWNVQNPGRSEHNRYADLFHYLDQFT